MKKLGCLTLFLAFISLTASAQGAHTVALKWTASTDAGATYNVPRLASPRHQLGDSGVGYCG